MGTVLIIENLGNVRKKHKIPFQCTAQTSSCLHIGTFFLTCMYIIFFKEKLDLKIINKTIVFRNIGKIFFIALDLKSNKHRIKSWLCHWWTFLFCKLCNLSDAQEALYILMITLVIQENDWLITVIQLVSLILKEKHYRN